MPQSYSICLSLSEWLVLEPLLYRFFAEFNMKLLFVLFVVFPVAELLVLIKVGSIFGVLNTLAIVLLTAFIGAALLRRQGLDTLMRANQRMQDGQIPAKEVVEGFLLAFGGALLLTPGFITDSIGFTLLLPQGRSLVAGYLVKHVMQSGGFNFQSGFQGTQSGQPGSSSAYRGGFSDNPFANGNQDNGADIIEGEFEELNDRAKIKQQPDEKN